MRVSQLKIHLDKGATRPNILLEPTIKKAHSFCIVYDIPPQQYGLLLEKYIRIKNNFTKTSSSECRGDCSTNGVNIEIKTSLGGASHSKFNWVQLRVSHDIHEYYLTAYHLTHENVDREGDLYVFRVSKEAILLLVAKYGHYAHGTVAEHGEITLENLTDEKNKKEYALRSSFGDKCWKSMLPFQIAE